MSERCQTKTQENGWRLHWKDAFATSCGFVGNRGVKQVEKKRNERKRICFAFFFS